MLKRFKSVGPAALVAAAFIGPGTVTTCSIAGASFGYNLLWALLFSLVAALVLQEMSARLGLIGQMGLGEALRQEFASPFGRLVTGVLVISAIAIGNAAYETGNILGGVMGLGVLTNLEFIELGSARINIWGPLIGILAFAILYIGKYRIIEKGLVLMVIIMSLTFLTTAVIVRPSLTKILQGLFIPRLSEGSLLTVVGLIGTTVVPYNLFLHASAVREKWKDKSLLGTVRADSLISLGAGGVISMAIVITSAAAFYGTESVISNAGDMASQLQPLLGSASSVFLAIGLMAAGVSSAITAPLAAAYATSGILGWKRSMKDSRFRSVWIAILITGTLFSSVGFSPVKAILFAQVANGILLPLISLFLLKVMNNKMLLGEHRNRTFANIAGFLVVLVTVILGIKSIISVIGLL
ncbi:MAG TPA: Nramp family divalent metal transporter [Bacteroidales bacterium]|nr:Nramp family divalent metal transporter [Bacteroidales bacterium]